MPSEPQPQRSEREKNKGLTPDGRRDAMTPLWEHSIEQPPSTDDKQWTVEWCELITPLGNRYKIEEDHQTGSAPSKRLKDEINAALAAAENAEVQRLRDLAMEIQELKRQLASERGPLRELAETAAFDRAVGLTNKLHVEPLKQQLLEAQAAIAFALNVEDKTWILPVDIDERLRNVDLSALEHHDAEVRSHGWNEGREHERKCAEAVRKPLVDAIEKAIRSLRFDCPSFVAREIANDLEAAIADAARPHEKVD